MLGLPGVGIQGAQAADQDRSFQGSGQRQQLRPIHQQLRCRDGLSAAHVVTEPVRRRFQRREGVRVGPNGPRMRPCARSKKGIFTSLPAFFAAASMAASPPMTIRSASETFSRRIANR